MGGDAAAGDRERFRSGRILICSNHGAFPHFIQDGVNGILIDIATTGWLGKAFESPRAFRSCGDERGGTTTYLAMFAPDRMNQGLVELYEKPRQAALASIGGGGHATRSIADARASVFIPRPWAGTATVAAN